MAIENLLGQISNKLGDNKVITPYHIAEKMVDDVLNTIDLTLETTFLDPVCKSGIFLKILYDKLMTHPVLVNKFEKQEDRSEYILEKMLYGIALDETCQLISARTLYGQVKQTTGNIVYIRNYINDIINKQYEKVRDTIGKEFKGMKTFGVIIGNPPYQESTGGGRNGAKAIYHNFIDLGRKICNGKVCFIVPSRWMTDTPNGIGSTWLSEIRNSDNFIKLVDYSDSSQVFDEVSIAGGVCYFIVSNKYHGDCDVTTVDKTGNEYNRVGKLAYTDGIIIRNSIDISILCKIRNIEGNNYLVNKNFSSIIGTNRLFSPTDDYFATNWDGFSVIKDETHYIKYYTNSRVCPDGEAYVSKDEIPLKALDVMKMFKMFLPLSGPTDGRVISLPIIGCENSCCSRTYAPMYDKNIIKNEDDCKVIIKYMKTKTFRALVNMLKTTQHATFINWYQCKISHHLLI